MLPYDGWEIKFLLETLALITLQELTVARLNNIQFIFQTIINWPIRFPVMRYNFSNNSEVIINDLYAGIKMRVHMPRLAQKSIIILDGVWQVSAGASSVSTRIGSISVK